MKPDDEPIIDEVMQKILFIFPFVLTDEAKSEIRRAIEEGIDKFWDAVPYSE